MGKVSESESHMLSFSQVLYFSCYSSSHGLA